MYELNNTERPYFGLDVIEPHWERVILAGDNYRPDSILYFDGSILKRQIISTNQQYRELQFYEATQNREILLPKIAKGKEQKFNAATLAKRHAQGIYLSVDEHGSLMIGNMTSQRTFYHSLWEQPAQTGKIPSECIAEFIRHSPEHHFADIERFKTQSRQHVKYKKGDYFCFKLNRTAFGFGRILVDIAKLQKSDDLSLTHYFLQLMGKPVLVQLFDFISFNPVVSLKTLNNQPTLPASLMMDNALFYGDYEIFAHDFIADDVYDFPMSLSLENDETIFHWGLIELKMETAQFYQIISDELQKLLKIQDFRQDSIGFSPAYAHFEILNHGICEHHYLWQQDLRNPKWQDVKHEIFTAFGVNVHQNYAQNCQNLGVRLPSEMNYGK
ncbi:MAG: immunity 26/phosphotriesterase HocA family protein [Acinetobacter sp.]|nr:immunity 26/phosphotriesterase HocA family protein [Acinetobacter sp.]